MDFGGEEFVADPVGMSGSSIQEKLDCAILDRVGTGAVGLAGLTFKSGPVTTCCKSIVGKFNGVVVSVSSFFRTSGIGIDCSDLPFDIDESF